MVLAVLCHACERGDHEDCEFPGPARNMTDSICKCEVCRGERDEENKKKAEDRELCRVTISRTLCTAKDYEVAMNQAVEELLTIPYHHWSMRCDDLVDKHFIPVPKFRSIIVFELFKRVAQKKGFIL